MVLNVNNLILNERSLNSVDHLHCLIENVLYTNVIHLPLGSY